MNNKLKIKIPEAKHFRSKAAKEKYAIVETSTYTPFQVSLAELYHQSNPDLKIPKVGESYTYTYLPDYYFKYKGEVWPVYFDDPGQQECIYIDGEWYGAGSYNFYPIPDFMDIIDSIKK